MNLVLQRAHADRAEDDRKEAGDEHLRQKGADEHVASARGGEDEEKPAEDPARVVRELRHAAADRPADRDRPLARPRLKLQVQRQRDDPRRLEDVRVRGRSSRRPRARAPRGRRPRERQDRRAPAPLRWGAVGASGESILSWLGLLPSSRTDEFLRPALRRCLQERHRCGGAAPRARFKQSRERRRRLAIGRIPTTSTQYHAPMHHANLISIHLPRAYDFRT